MRFRRHKFAVSADIIKMYRQIEIVPNQWNLQRIFFRENPNLPLKEYCLVVVTYGFASSPYISVKAMQDGAKKYQLQFPKAVQAIHEDFYMDDCTTGDSNEENAIQLAKDIRTVLDKNGFPLSKWRSNSQRLVKELAGDDAASVLFEQEEKTSILGLKWLPKTDELTFAVNQKPIIEFTKRNILSTIHQLYDPNGLVAPVITRAKLLIQALWKEKLTWDEPVSVEIIKQWKTIWSNIDELEKIRIPRWFGMTNHSHLQLHAFADSSGKAYGGVVYLRIQHPNNEIECHLIAAKSKVAPIKQITIPRLELAAAHLAGKLLASVKKAMELETVPFYLWTDNIAAIIWIHTGLHKLKVYVANRVADIRQVSEPHNWNHVRSEHNPADLISRGIAPQDIIKNELWWNGPPWLKLSQNEWPTPVNVSKFHTPSDVASEIRINSTQLVEPLLIHMPTGAIPLLDYTNTCAKLCRIIVYVQRFIDKCRNKKISQNQRRNKVKPCPEIDILRPSVEEKRQAMKCIIRAHQQHYFQREYVFLLEQRDKIIDEVQRNKKQYFEIDYRKYPSQSNILALRPFIDRDGIIRIGNRGKHASIPFDAKHPILIEQCTRLSYLIINEAHYALGHGSVQIMTQYIRQVYWMQRLRDTLRQYLSKCTTCARYTKTFETQLMADVPSDRVNQNRAFLITGVDYAGPIPMVMRYRGTASHQKCWIAIFVCMVTRAVHIDVVTDNTSMAFIMCFERFIARRGHCNRLYSDNGTNFRGAYKEIKAAY